MSTVTTPFLLSFIPFQVVVKSPGELATQLLAGSSRDGQSGMLSLHLIEKGKRFA
jgi:hypothetical protein